MPTCDTGGNRPIGLPCRRGGGVLGDEAFDGVAE